MHSTPPHKSVALQLPPPEEQGVNKLKAVDNILDLHCKSKIRVKHSSVMYNALQCSARLSAPPQESQTLCLSFGCIAASANASDKLRVRFISMEFLSLCIKKKKNISKTKMISGVRHRHLYQLLGNVVVFNICR